MPKVHSDIHGSFIRHKGYLFRSSVDLRGKSAKVRFSFYRPEVLTATIDGHVYEFINHGPYMVPHASGRLCHLKSESIFRDKGEK